MRTLIWAALALALATLPAAAQQAIPCERSQNRLALGGIDMDEMRCEQALMRQQVGTDLATLEAKLAASTAAAVLAKHDLSIAQKDLADAAKRLKDWEQYFSAYIAKPPAEGQNVK